MEEKQHILIERYLRNGLNDEELQAFKLRLANEEGFAEEVRLHQQAKIALWLDHTDQLKTELDELGGTLLQSRNNSSLIKKLSWQKLSIAAALLFLIVSGIIYLLALPPSSNLNHFVAQELAEITLPNSIDRGKSPGIDQQWQNVTELFNNGQFEEAKPIFEQFENEESNAYARFFLGVIAFHQQQYSDAIQYFQTITQNDYPYFDRSEWLIALAYLKDGKEELAKEQLKEISETKNQKFKEDSKNLLERLNQ